MTRANPDVRFVCGECGCDFLVKERYARMIRNGTQERKCRRCLRRGKAIPVTDTERRFWLSRFSDTELASIASALFDAPFRPERFARAREHVMGEPAVMMAAGVSPDDLAA